LFGVCHGAAVDLRDGLTKTDFLSNMALFTWTYWLLIEEGIRNMIRANISEVKNRLSYYLKLVKGGEQVEILDRKTPLARIVHVSVSHKEGGEASEWILEARQLGLVEPPSKGPVDPELLEKDLMSGIGQAKESGALQALLDERRGGR